MPLFELIGLGRTLSYESELQMSGNAEMAFLVIYNPMITAARSAQRVNYPDLHLHTGEMSLIHINIHAREISLIYIPTPWIFL